MSPPHESERLKRLLAIAQENKAHFTDEFNRTQHDVFVQRLSHFEKIAVLQGGTAALVITFIGNHSASSLEPAWAIKAALVLLLIGMSASIIRNFKSGDYFYNAKLNEMLKSWSEEQEARFAYNNSLQNSLSLQTGKPLDRAAHDREFNESNKALRVMVSGKDAEVDRDFKKYRALESGSHYSTFAALVLLIWTICKSI